MDWTRRFLQRATPQSAFGLTLVTIVAMILIVGFFARDIYLVSVDGAPSDGSNPYSDRNLVRWPGDSSDANKEESLLSKVPNGQIVEDDDSKDADGGSVVSASPKIASLTRNNWPANRKSHDVHKRAKKQTVSPGYVAVLARTSDCRWSNEANKLADGVQFKVGQTINIAAGLAEIVFGCGAKAVLEGPAVLKLQSSKSGELTVGKITANVPDEVQGFALNTPTARITTFCESIGKEPKGVAKLTDTSDCRWANGNSVADKGDCIEPGQTLKLDSGLAEITFKNGAKLIIEGPASLEIESDKTARLHSGKITADVPDELEGFKILTPVAEIMSLPAKSSRPKDETVAKE